MSLVELVSSLSVIPKSGISCTSYFPLGMILELATEEHMVELEELAMRNGDSLSNIITSDNLRQTYIYLRPDDGRSGFGSMEIGLWLNTGV